MRCSFKYPQCDEHRVAGRAVGTFKEAAKILQGLKRSSSSLSSSAAPDEDMAGTYDYEVALSSSVLVGRASCTLPRSQRGRKSGPVRSSSAPPSVRGVAM